MISMGQVAEPWIWIVEKKELMQCLKTCMVCARPPQILLKEEEDYQPTSVQENVLGRPNQNGIRESRYHYILLILSYILVSL